MGRRARRPRAGEATRARRSAWPVSPFAPDSVVVGNRHLEVGSEWVASFAVTGFPREVHPGWLAPLLTYPGRVDVSVHVDPVDPVTAANRLRRQLAKLESGRRSAAEHGRLLDPQVEAATEDAYDLSDRVARGEGKLFRVGLYLSVHAATETGLADEVAALRALTASLLLDARPATFRSLQGWVSTLPLGLDQLGMRRTFDTAALGAAFPFTSPDLPAPDPASAAAPAGVFYGYGLGSQGLVHWDRFDPGQHNHNATVLGRSGSGKSYFVKLELLRSLYRGITVAVVDPEDEYSRLAAAVGGTTVHLGARGVRFNPFDLPITTGADGRRTAPRDSLVRRSLFLHTALAVLVGTEIATAGRASLDRAIAASYRGAGITGDPRTWTRPAPTLRDLRDHLADAGRPRAVRPDPAGLDVAAEGAGQAGRPGLTKRDGGAARRRRTRSGGSGETPRIPGGDRVAADLAERLHPFVDGAFSTMFDGATTTRPDGHLVVFSLRHLPDEMKAVGTLLALDAVARRVGLDGDTAERRPSMVVVDEAWLLMRDPAGAQFLFRMAKAARKRWVGLTVATQDTADVLGTELGRAVVANSATQILLRQAPQAIDEVTRTFDLSAGERQFLLAADRGQGLLSTGTHRIAFQAVASAAEHNHVTSNPADAAEQSFAEADEAPYVDLADAAFTDADFADAARATGGHVGRVGLRDLEDFPDLEEFDDVLGAV